jgi:hypothetical protein
VLTFTIRSCTRFTGNGPRKKGAILPFFSFRRAMPTSSPAQLYHKVCYFALVLGVRRAERCAALSRVHELWRTIRLVPATRTRRIGAYCIDLVHSVPLIIPLYILAVLVCSFSENDAMVILNHLFFYSKNCHSKNFGTRDLRQANLPHTPKDLSPSPPRATATSPTSPLRRVLTRRHLLLSLLPLHRPLVDLCSLP